VLALLSTYFDKANTQKLLDGNFNVARTQLATQELIKEKKEEKKEDEPREQKTINKASTDKVKAKINVKIEPPKVGTGSDSGGESEEEEDESGSEGNTAAVEVEAAESASLSIGEPVVISLGVDDSEETLVSALANTSFLLLTKIEVTSPDIISAYQYCTATASARGRENDSEEH